MGGAGTNTDDGPSPHCAVGTILNLSRIIDDDLKHKMAGLDACSKEGIRYWEEQYERALQSGALGASSVKRKPETDHAVIQDSSTAPPTSKRVLTSSLRSVSGSLRTSSCDPK